MKNLIKYLSSLILTISAGVTMTGGVNNIAKKENDLYNYSQFISLSLNNHNSTKTIISNKLQEPKAYYLKNNKLEKERNIDAFYWYFVYAKAYLSHDTVKTVDRNVPAGIGVVGAALSFFIPGALAAIVAAILIAQWAIWNIPSYDYGFGIIIQFACVLGIPIFITGIYSQ